MRLYTKEAEAAGRPALVILVRHGQSFRNEVKKDNMYLPENSENDENIKQAIVVPDVKIGLTEFGQRQATETGNFIRNQFGVFDCVYDSGYTRTIETKNGIMESYTPDEIAQMKFRTHHLLSERNPGYTYSMTTEQANLHFPYLAEHWKLFGPFKAVPAGGESQEYVCNRIYDFIGILFRQRAGKSLLINCHGGVIRAIRFNLEKWTMDQYVENYNVNPPENCGVTTYLFNPDTNRIELNSYNQVYWK